MGDLALSGSRQPVPLRLKTQRSVSHGTWKQFRVGHFFKFYILLTVEKFSVSTSYLKFNERLTVLLKSFFFLLLDFSTSREDENHFNDIQKPVFHYIGNSREERETADTQREEYISP